MKRVWGEFQWWRRPEKKGDRMLKSFALKGLIFILLNLACFYGLKAYNDNRQVHIVSALLPAVVKVSPLGRQVKTIKLTPTLKVQITYPFGRLGHGSGVFLDRDGLLVTCAHVVKGVPLVELSLNEDKETISPKGYKLQGKVLAYVIGRDEEHDVALLRLVDPLFNVSHASLGNSVKKGLAVLTIGFPGPFHKYVTAGVVSGSANGMIFSDVVVAPGNSGGGVFNVNGELVGLARGFTGPTKLPTYQGFTVLTTLHSIRALVEKYKGF